MSKEICGLCNKELDYNKNFVHKCKETNSNAFVFMYNLRVAWWQIILLLLIATILVWIWWR